MTQPTRLLIKEEFDSLARTAEELIFGGTRKGHANRLRKFNFTVGHLSTELPPYPANVLREMASFVETACGRVNNKDHWVTVARASIQKARMFCVESSE